MPKTRPPAVISDEQVLAALLRTSFALRKAFREIGAQRDIRWNYHIDAIIYQLDCIRLGDNRRLIVTIPPRHLKSVIMTAWVAWTLGNNPAAKFICASYGYDLAEKHARDCLKIITSGWYRQAFPRLRLDKKAVMDFTTTAGGSRLSTSCWARGDGTSFASRRLRQRTSRLRLGRSDSIKDAQATRFTLRGNRWPSFASSRRKKNPLSFAAQQQQYPVPVTGNFVDPAWFQYCDAPSESGVVVQSWDTASKTSLDSAFSVGITTRMRVSQRALCVRCI